MQLLQWPLNIAATTLSPLFFTNGVKSENIPPSEIKPGYIVGAPASTPGQIPNDTPGVDYVGSQNLPPPPRIYPPPLLWICEVYSAPRIYLSLPEYTPFSTNICDPPRIYTPSSQNIPPFSTIICDPPKIYPSVPEYRPYPPFQQLYATLPESTPPPSKNIPPFSTTICDPPRFYPSLPECTPFSMSTICDPPTIYPSLPE